MLVIVFMTGLILSAAAGSPAGDFEYRIFDGTITITGYIGSGGAVDIPAEINGYPVTKIEGYVFRSVAETLTSLNFPASIAKIDAGAIPYGMNLMSLTIHNPQAVISLRTRPVYIWGGRSDVPSRSIEHIPLRLPSDTVVFGHPASTLERFFHRRFMPINPTVYSTDILAFVNGRPIQSYNIMGRTFIVAEDLFEDGFGFTGEWSEEERLLSLIPNRVFAEEHQSIERNAPDKVVGEVLFTDIRVRLAYYHHPMLGLWYFDIPSYNIGGRTLIAIESLGYHPTNHLSRYSINGARYTWNEYDRTIRLYFKWYDDAGYFNRSFSAYMV